MCDSRLETVSPRQLDTLGAVLSWMAAVAVVVAALVFVARWS